MEKILLSVDETANLTGLTKRQVMDLCRQNKLPAMKFGKHWSINKEKLENLIQRKTTFYV